MPNYETYQLQKPRSPKDALGEYEVTLNVPRFITCEKNTYIKVINRQFDFVENNLYLRGKYKITLKRLGDGVYLEKEKTG